MTRLSSVESIQGSAFGDTYVSTNYAGASAVGSIPATFNEFEGMGGDDSITGTWGQQRRDRVLRERAGRGDGRP